jgi:DNA-binding NarL/FixJ family response regulator
MAELFECIEHVRKGFIWAQGREAIFLQEALMRIPAPNLAIAIDPHQLTPRQLQVVQYAAAGKTNKVIAAELRLSEHTVKNYLFRAFEKLGVSNRVELLFYLMFSGHSVNPRAAALTTDSRVTTGSDSRRGEHFNGKNGQEQAVENSGGI